MPIYTYKCSRCMISHMITKSMVASDNMEFCPECSYNMNRDFQADMFHTSADSYQTPLVSDSMAISMDQVAEHKRECPDIEITKEGQPVFTSYKQHEAYLKKTGFVKSPKRKRVSERHVAKQSDR